MIYHANVNAHVSNFLLPLRNIIDQCWECILHVYVTQQNGDKSGWSRWKWFSGQVEAHLIVIFRFPRCVLFYFCSFTFDRVFFLWLSGRVLHVKMSRTIRWEVQRGRKGSKGSSDRFAIVYLRWVEGDRLSCQSKSTIFFLPCWFKSTHNAKTYITRITLCCRNGFLL